MPLGFFFCEAKHRPDRRLGINLLGFCRRSLLSVRRVRPLARLVRVASGNCQRKTCSKGERQAVMDNGHPVILGETASSRAGARREPCARNGAAMEAVIAANLAAVRSRIATAARAAGRASDSVT